MATNKRNKSWQTEFVVAGKRYRATFDTEEEGVRWEEDVRIAIDRGNEPPAALNKRTETGGKLITLKDAFDYTKESHWENNPQIKAPEVQIQSAREALEFFGPNKRLDEIDTDEMKRFARAIVASGRTHSTADRKLAALSKMLKCAHERGAAMRLHRVPMAKQTNERLRFLTKDEAERILKLWKEWHQDDLYHFTIFALHTGARLGAITDLKWQSFSPGKTAVVFWGGDKKSNARTLPIPANVRFSLDEMQRLHPDEKGPFTHLKKGDATLRLMWDRMREHLDMPDVVIHTLRHTCASWMVQNGVDLKRVQTWLGHKRIETTLIYAKLATGDLEVCADVLGKMLPSSSEALARAS